MKHQRGTDGTPSAEQVEGVVSLEKALLVDVCLGMPLGKWFDSIERSETEEIIAAAPDTAILRSDQLALLKAAYARRNKAVTAAVNAISRMADACVAQGVFSVATKSRPAPSGSLNDYCSLAKYWWPNPETENGLPYVRKDGEVNPECYGDGYDYLKLVRFSEATVILALSAYLTGKREHAAHLESLLQTWFLDENTRQTPHFEYAQLTPGAEGPRGAGLVEARFLVYVTDAVRLLEGAGFLPPAVADAVRGWFSNLLTWFRTSRPGAVSEHASNNIAFWHDVQLIAYADFCGRDDLVVETLQSVMPRTADQISDDGALTHELKRSRPYDYVAFTLAAMALISGLGEKHGITLWDQPEADGRNFQAAHDWLLAATHSRPLIEQLLPRGPTTTGFDLGHVLEIGLRVRGAERASLAQKEVAQAAELKVQELQAELASSRQGRNSEEFRNLRRRYAHQLRTIRNARRRADARVRQVLVTLNEERKESASYRKRLEAELEVLKQRLDEKLALLKSLEGKADTELRKAVELSSSLQKKYLLESIRRRAARAREAEMIKERDILAAQLNRIIEEMEKTRRAHEMEQSLRESMSTELKEKVRVIDDLRTNHDREIRFLQAQVDAGKAMWEYYAKKSEDYRQQCMNARKELASAKRNQEKLQAKVDEIQDVCAVQARKLDELNRRVKILDKQTRDIAGYALKLEGSLKAVHESTSWKVTRPLRAIILLLTGRKPRKPRVPKKPESLKRVLKEIRERV